MQIIRSSSAQWTGSGKDGQGSLTSQSGILNDTNFGFQSRFSSGPGTNPEELIAAAHAGCFSMKLAFVLQAKGVTPSSISTTCKLVFEDGTITQSNLFVSVSANGISHREMAEALADAKANCPVSKLLNATITLTPETIILNN